MAPKSVPTWRRVRRVIAAVLSLLALIGATRLTVPTLGDAGDEPPGVRRQLAFVRAQLNDGAGERAQDQFPEGSFFLHVLYGLAWVDLMWNGLSR